MVKGPKLLNPADKARKEARKKELKKNKKQRQQVRSAAIENRNPEQILAELEQLDKQEYDPDNLKQQQQQQSSTTPHTSSDLLYTEKRKRLKELFARCLAHYEKEDPERHTKLKSLESDYEAKLKKIRRDFDAVKAAAEISIDDVFLPPEPSETELVDEIADDDPLMAETIYITPLAEGITPPGCPPGPPPDLKQLVESLKSPALMPTTAHMLPAHLLNSFGRGFQHNNKRQAAPPYRGPTSGGPSGSNSEQQRKRAHLKPGAAAAAKKQHQHLEKPFQGDAPGKAIAAGSHKSQQRPSDLSKSAVIESKPVIFMPKATKFLPASVRSKVQPKQSAAAAAATDDHNR